MKRNQQIDWLQNKPPEETWIPPYRQEGLRDDRGPNGRARAIGWWGVASTARLKKTNLAAAMLAEW